jgi:MFS family permease
MSSILKVCTTFSGMSSFQILAMFRRGLFYSYLSIYLREYLGLSVTETTLLATIPMTVSATFQAFVWGRVSDKLQLRKSLILLGEVLASIGTVALWYAHIQPESKHMSGYVIILGLATIEIFWSMSNVGWTALISDIYAKEDRASIKGQLASVGAIGRIIGVWIGGVLYDGLGAYYKGWGFQEGSLFFVAAGAMLISTVPMFFVPEGGIKDELEGDDASEGASRYPERVFMIFLVAMIFINFGKNSMAVLRAPFLSLESGFGLSSREMSYLINVRSLAMIVTGFGAGIFCRRFGDGKSLVIGTVATTVALLIFGFAPTVYVAGLGNMLMGASDTIIMAASYAFASVLIPPNKRGHFFGMFNATMFLSFGFAGTVIAGPLIDLLISRGSEELFAYQMAFVTSVVITAIGLGILSYLLLRVMKTSRA